MSEEPKYGTLTIIHEVDGERVVQLFPRVKEVAYSYENYGPYHIGLEFDALADETGVFTRRIVPVEDERQNLENLLLVALLSVTQDALVTDEHERRLAEELSMVLVEMGVKLS